MGSFRKMDSASWSVLNTSSRLDLFRFFVFADLGWVPGLLFGMGGAGSLVMFKVDCRCVGGEWCAKRKIRNEAWSQRLLDPARELQVKF